MAAPSKKIKTENNNSSGTSHTVNPEAKLMNWKWQKYETLIWGDSGTKSSALVCSFDMVLFLKIHLILCLGWNSYNY